MDWLNGPKIDSPQPAVDLNGRGKFQRMLPSMVGKCEDQNKIQVLIPLPGHYGIGLSIPYGKQRNAVTDLTLESFNFPKRSCFSFCGFQA
jgi:hypothetical protein